MNDRRDRAYCRSCGKQIIWCQHETTGKRAPIDAVPNPAGNCILLPDGKYRVLRKSDPPVRTLTYSNHFQTCPNAAEHASTRRVG